MKLHILSDLHLEFSNYQPHEAADEADVIVLAGDIWKKDHGLHWARSTWTEKPIVYVPGNHEFYGVDRRITLERIRTAAKELDIHLLDNDEVIIDGLRFLGCTLWTDFVLFGVNDFRLILDGEGLFTAKQSAELHGESVKWLEFKLKESFGGKTVVITHQAPSLESVVPKYKDDLLSACFASNLEHLMGFSELWIHGHMHDSLDYEINGTRVICNPRGYCRDGYKNENANFNPALIVDLDAPFTNPNSPDIEALTGLE